MVGAEQVEIGVKDLGGKRLLCCFRLWSNSRGCNINFINHDTNATFPIDCPPQENSAVILEV